MVPLDHLAKKRTRDGSFKSVGPTNTAVPKAKASQTPHTGKSQTNGVGNKGMQYGEKRTAGLARGKDTERPLHTFQQKKEKLLQSRKQLPIWPHAQQIRAALSSPNSSVLLLVGETGSGKSTQVPQFLLSEPWLGANQRIAITQPRRVAAISLARRVADEVGTPLGKASPTSKVGYSVRFDINTAPGTRVKFLTEGMLLQEMLRDPSLKEYGVVIVDEVHERSVNVDLILGFLRKLVCDKEKRKGKPLKVVVMSATADVEALHNYFQAGFDTDVQPKSKRTAISGQDMKPESTEKEAAKSTVSGGELVGDHASASDAKSPDTLFATLCSAHIKTLHIKGRQYPVKITYLPAYTADIVEESLKTIFQIHLKEPLPGDILVFLTGQETIESLEKLINQYAANMDAALPKIQTLPLFAALPQHAQQRVFESAPPRTRKVIISTNIAETSVTVPGVRFVVDAGKMKVKKYRANLGLESLLVESVSKSSAIQRQGRAGREAPGHCFRLYTEQAFDALADTTTPEILRCDLAQAVLTMKARGIEDVVNFPLLDPPPRPALEKALLQLYNLGALEDDGSIGKVGKTIAKMPLSPTLGRTLIEAAKPERDCLLDVIDIIACLSVETIFLPLITEEKKEAAESARRELRRRDGDHLTLLAVVKAYATENSNRKAWCERHFVNHRAMKNVMDVRKQLRQQCQTLGLIDEVAVNTAIEEPTTDSADDEAHTAAVLQCLLKGFIFNTARLMPDGSYHTFFTNQQVAIHPSSVLFGRKVEAIMFTEWVWTNRSYGRSVSVVRPSWVEEAFIVSRGS